MSNVVDLNVVIEQLQKTECRLSALAAVRENDDNPTSSQVYDASELVRKAYQLLEEVQESAAA
jgi:hypothetical protein